jgi:hypothetical protein
MWTSSSPDARAGRVDDRPARVRPVRHLTSEDGPRRRPAINPGRDLWVMSREAGVSVRRTTALYPTVTTTAPRGLSQQ